MKTSELVAQTVKTAVAACHLPEGVFAHIYGKSFEIGKALVKHPYIKAVGFTGSFQGGKQLFDWANQRKVPIPVFAEMSSVNPVFLLPGKMKEAATETAKQYAASVTLGMGQFCTNPSCLLELTMRVKNFTVLAAEIRSIVPAAMFIMVSAKYFAKRSAMQPRVQLLATSDTDWQNRNANYSVLLPILSKTHTRVFGPYSLVIKCKDLLQMIDVKTY